MTKSIKALWRVKQFSKRLKADNSGLALIEFALSLPIMMALGITGSDTAMYVQSTMMISQISLAVADNVSRVGETSSLSLRKIYESDVNDIFVGAEKLAGENDFYGHARVIISSVEYDTDGIPYIHWQRCQGTKAHPSSYGIEGTGKNDTTLAAGIGPTGRKVVPVPGTALIFVEVSYDYQSLFGLAPYIGQEINSTAAFNVRETRDLSAIFNKSGSDVVSSCT
jgi:Flp pilus assembly protein TadG